MTVIKDRSIVNPVRSLKLLKRGSYKGKKDQTLKKFLYAKNRYLLAPKILVRYRREPFTQPTPELRITFDSDIRVSKVDSRWNVGAQTQQIFPQIIVMEIKFTGSLPFWLAEIVRVHNLERRPFSKYAFSIEKIKSHLPWITF